MKLIRKLFLLTAVLLLIWGGVYSYNQITDGFSIRQMTSSLPPYPQFEVSISDEKKGELQDVLSQSFRYIGKGTQSYVFESADRNYMLKFFKHKHLRPFTWLNSIPLPPKLRKISDAKIERRQKRVENLFSSYKLAYNEMEEETGLLYIHLNRIPIFESEVVLIDKLGLKHRIQLDQYEYMIQKKAVIVKEVFADVETEEQLRIRIEQLIAAVIVRCEKGIADRDRSFVQNIAFCVDEPRALFIDAGGFYKDPEMRTAEEQSRELKKRLGELSYWSERYFPEFVPIVDEYLEGI